MQVPHRDRQVDDFFEHQQLCFIRSQGVRSRAKCKRKPDDETMLRMAGVHSLCVAESNSNLFMVLLNESLSSVVRDKQCTAARSSAFVLLSIPAFYLMP